MFRERRSLSIKSIVNDVCRDDDEEFNVEEELQNQSGGFGYV